MVNKALIAGAGLGILGLVLLFRKAEVTLKMEPGTGDERITITQISAEQDGDIIAFIKWKHNIQAVIRDAAFVEAETSIGRMENGVWNNYFTVSAKGHIPMINRIGTLTAFWALIAVEEMPEGPAGFRCQITAYNEGWQTIAQSPWYVTENIIEVK